MTLRIAYLTGEYPRATDTFIQREVAALRAHGIEVARKGLTDGDQSLIKEIEGHGVNVVTLTPEERQAFVDATRPVYDAWKVKIGADLVDMAEQSIANR